MSMKKILAALLAAVMVFSLAACTGGKTDTTGTTGGGVQPGITIEKFEGDFIYKDSVSVVSTNWNPHTYQGADQSYPLDFITSGLYTFVYNDELHEVEGKDPYSGYKIIPELAAGDPVDVTEQIKKDYPQFGIPSTATAGFAYTIDLNPNATFDNGKKITAKTYVESVKRLLDPRLKNYRAEDIYSGDFVLAGAENYTNQGGSRYAALGKSVREWLEAGNKVEDLYINIYEFWGITAADGRKWVSVTDDTLIRDPAVAEGEDEDYVSAKYLYETYLAPGKAYHEYGYSSTLCGYVSGAYPETFSFDNVGIFASGDYQITIVLEQSLTGFYLYYSIGIVSLALVDVELYDSCLKEKDGVWTSTYCTSLDTTVSYGPYKMSDYQLDKSMHFVRNDSWFGYTDGQHVYKDPTDGKYYPMYQTTEIDTQYVENAATRKLMFLSGQLMGYGLQTEDFEQYRNSEFCYSTPATTIFFLTLNGNLSAIQKREAAADFDQTKKDLETITLTTFRKALAVTYDKELFASTISPSRSGAYSIIGNLYVYDVDSGARYRDTEQAKKALCDFYSVDVSKYDSLDDAVKSITGYDPVTAKKLFTEAFNEALEKGFITSADGKTCDQTIEMVYSMSVDNDFMTQTIDYLNEKLAEVLVGTPFEGKIKFVKSAPLGDPGWSDSLKAGSTDVSLCGWQGSALNPFSLTDLYTNPVKSYDAGWFDATTVQMTLNVNVGGVDKTEMKDVTMSLYQWSDCLNGKTITIDGVEYNFGDGQTDIDTRLTILAGFEAKILSTYNYLPMLQNASMALLSQQVYYVVDEYSPVMGRGGIAYMKYNYNETEWAAFVKAQGGELKY